MRIFVRAHAAACALLLTVGAGLSAAPASAAPLLPDESATQTTTDPAQFCPIYPIALPATLLTGATANQRYERVAIGGAAGIAWLTWSGQPSAQTLERSLVPPGDSHTYVHPDNSADHRLDRGDWAAGVSGNVNAAGVQSALTALLGQDLVLPVWSESRGPGGRTDYRVAKFALVRLTAAELSGQSTLSFDYLRDYRCYNVAPVAIGAALTTLEDTALAVALQATDANGDALTYTVTSPVTHGALTGTAPNLTYTPAPNFFGQDQLQFRVSDGESESAVVTVSLTVNAVNDAPTATDEVLTTAEDTARSITLQASDIDGDALTYTVAASPSHGTLTGIAPNFSYAPASNFFGEDTLKYRVSDGTLNSAIATVRLTVSPVNDAPTANNLSAEAEQGESVQVTLAGTDIENDALTFRIVDAPDHGSLDGTAPILRYVPMATFSGSDSFRYVANDGAADSAPAIVSIQVTPRNTQICDPADSDADGDGVIDAACIETFVPPNPNTVAPPHDPTISIDFLGSSDFLISGPQPIQRGIDIDIIERRLAAVIRGRVLNEHLQPLSGALVRVVGKPEFGYTYTRADGQYDLLVNGGGVLTVDFSKDGYLRAQRQSDRLPWQGFGGVEDVALVQLDPNATRVTLGPAAAAQVVRGSATSDDDGSRQGTLFVPAGTEATLKLRDGTQLPVSSLNLRATEYTVGEAGPLRMPGPLPVSSGYTYAVELSADEAIDVDAESVRFNKPVAYYVENFLEFPVGTIVPVGYYDFKAAAWRASDNGVIVKILGVNGGVAQIDIKGEGVAATAAELSSRGIDAAELALLAQTYQVGTALWRAPIPHLTPWDLNFPVKPPEDAIRPNYEEPGSELNEDEDKCEEECGSIIGAQNSSLGEVINIPGTPIQLRYDSLRADGMSAYRKASVKLLGDTLPASLKAIDLTWNVAGQSVTRRVTNVQAGASFPFTWDGHDAYGRDVIGTQSLQVKVSYVYDAVYAVPADVQRAFAAWSGSGATLATDRSRGEISLSAESRIDVSGRAIDASQLGGFHVADQHAFDMRSGSLQYGDGSRQTVGGLPKVGRLLVGAYGAGIPILSEGKKANEVRVTGAMDMVMLPEGGVLLAGPGAVVWKIGTDGIVRRFLGNGTTCVDVCITDGDAPTTSIGVPVAVSVAGDGTVFVATQRGHVLRVRDGKVQLAWRSPSFLNATSMALAKDGRLFLGVLSGAGIYQLDANAEPGSAESMRWQLIAGADRIPPGANSASGYSGTGGPAKDAKIRMGNMVVGPDGLLYLGEHHVIRRVGLDGRITRVAGMPSPSCDGYTSPSSCRGPATIGIPAVDSRLNDSPTYIAFLPNGDLLFTDDRWDLRANTGSVKRIDSQGIIREVRPGVSSEPLGSCPNYPATPACQPNAPDPSYRVSSIRDMEIDATGALLALDPSFAVIHRLGTVVPGLSVMPMVVPSKSGSHANEFDEFGRHASTRDTLTGRVLSRFEYDPVGRLEAVRDADGRRTLIERNPNGSPRAIVAPHGQRTELEFDAEGKLKTVRDPLHNEHRLTYYPGGLLKTFQRPGAAASTMTYAADGRLESDVNPLTGGWVLDRSQIENGRRVVLTSAEGRTQTYDTQVLPTGEKVRTTRHRDGSMNSRIEFPNGQTTHLNADGSETIVTIAPDSRFGLMAPLRTLQSKVSGLATITTQQARSVTLSNQNDPLSVSTWVETTTVNGRAYASSYDAATRTLVARTPMNRTRSAVLNADGKVASLSIPGLASVSYSYDGEGRIDTVTQTADGKIRTTQFGYDAFGFVSSVTDPARRDVGLTNDAIGRTQTQTLPDRRQIGFDHNPRGNVTGITPPGRATHNFDYDDLDQLGSYTPPSVGSGTSLTDYDYNLDRQLERVTRPDGAVIDPQYLATTGQLSSIGTPEGSYGFEFLPGGRLQSATAPGNHSLRYFWSGPYLRQIVASGAAPGTVGFSYNQNRWLTNLNSPGLSVIYGYDNDGLLTSTKLGATTLTLARNATNGLLDGTSVGAMADTWEVTGFGEPRTYTAKYGTATQFSASYLRDDLGRIESRTESTADATRVESYGYDAAGRLDTVHVAGALASDYHFDANGNRDEHTIGAASKLRGQALPCLGDLSGTNEIVVVGQYDAQDRMTAYGTCTFGYTANGELERRTDTATNATTRYRYDVFGNLRTATLANGTELAYDIDGQNRRIGKRVNGARVQGFLYLNQLEPIAELNGSGNVVASFVYADRANTPSLMLKSGKTYRIVADHLGSVRLVIDIVTGDVAQRMEYDEYGNVVADTNPGFQPFGYAGGIYDRDTALVRFGARDYDPIGGRWTAKDPVGFAARRVNLYAYVSSDPIGFTDPTGLVDVNLVPSWEPAHRGMNQIQSPEGTLTAGFHYDGENIYGRSGKPISFDEFVNELMNDPRYDESDWIKLYSCRTAVDFGQGSLAKRLAEITQKGVIGADNFLHIGETQGYLGIYGKTPSGDMDMSRPGGWQEIRPESWK